MQMQPEMPPPLRTSSPGRISASAHRIWPVVCRTFFAAALLLVGCGKEAGAASTGKAPSKSGAAAPTIVAHPNPVPAGEGNGATELTWDLGEDSEAQVYVSINDGPEQLLAQNQKGTKPVDWIATGAVYEFRLYAGTDHQTLKARVRVTRSDH
jgi:hypothetical protein